MHDLKSAKSSPRRSRCFRQVENSHFLSDRSSSSALPKARSPPRSCRRKGAGAAPPSRPRSPRSPPPCSLPRSSCRRGAGGAQPPLTAASSCRREGRAPRSPRPCSLPCRSRRRGAGLVTAGLGQIGRRWPEKKDLTGGARGRVVSVAG